MLLLLVLVLLVLVVLALLLLVLAVWGERHLRLLQVLVGLRQRCQWILQVHLSWWE